MRYRVKLKNSEYIHILDIVIDYLNHIYLFFFTIIFRHQRAFYGVDLTSLQPTALSEVFRQPIVVCIPIHYYEKKYRVFVNIRMIIIERQTLFHNKSNHHMKYLFIELLMK